MCTEKNNKVKSNIYMIVDDDKARDTQFFNFINKLRNSKSQWSKSNIHKLQIPNDTIIENNSLIILNIHDHECNQLLYLLNSLNFSKDWNYKDNSIIHIGIHEGFFTINHEDESVLRTFKNQIPIIYGYNGKISLEAIYEYMNINDK